MWIAPGMEQVSTHSCLHFVASHIDRFTSTPPPDVLGRIAPSIGHTGTQGGFKHPRQTTTANPSLPYPPIVFTRIEALSMDNTFSLIRAQASTH